MSNELKKIYISGALTGITDPERIKKFYEEIKSLCENLGFQVHAPHLYTDPLKNPEISPRQVFLTDKHKVCTSDLVIAYVGIPSLGVGMELAYAEINAIPLVLLYEQDKVVSRFPRGIPSVISEIQFVDTSDALDQIKGVLVNLSL